MNNAEAPAESLVEDLPYRAYNIVSLSSVDSHNTIIFFHYLPTYARSYEEMLSDRATESAYNVSQIRSSLRRKSSRINSRFVVEYLDELDHTLTQFGKYMGDIALRNINILESTES